MNKENQNPKIKIVSFSQILSLFVKKFDLSFSLSKSKFQVAKEESFFTPKENDIKETNIFYGSIIKTYNKFF